MKQKENKYCKNTEHKFIKAGQNIDYIGNIKEIILFCEKCGFTVNKRTDLSEDN